MSFCAWIKDEEYRDHFESGESLLSNAVIILAISRNLATGF